MANIYGLLKPRLIDYAKIKHAKISNVKISGITIVLLKNDYFVVHYSCCWLQFLPILVHYFIHCPSKYSLYQELHFHCHPLHPQSQLDSTKHSPVLKKLWRAIAALINVMTLSGSAVTGHQNIYTTWNKTYKNSMK